MGYPSYSPDEPEQRPRSARYPAAGWSEDDGTKRGAEAEAAPTVAPRIAGSDPVFGFLVAIALSVGLTPLIPENTELRYVLCWSVLAAFGVLAWLSGRMSPIQTDTTENLVWGVVFALNIGVPLLLFGTNVLATTAQLLFRARAGDAVQPLAPGSVLALLVFAQPLAETLFFRGLFQQRRSFWLVGLLAAAWSALLYFPALDLGGFPIVGLVITIALLLMNLIYGYVRQRNGLAAAWLCQIALNIFLLFIPFVTAR